VGKPFVQAADQEWAARVVQLPKVTDGGSITFAGPCPRCDDPMSCTVDIGPTPRMDGEEDVIPRVGPERYVVYCNCSGDHAGRPAGEEGCGAFGALAPVVSRG
jgi:hypothetical protein